MPKPKRPKTANDYKDEVKPLFAELFGTMHAELVLRPGGEWPTDDAKPCLACGAAIIYPMPHVTFHIKLEVLASLR